MEVWKIIFLSKWLISRFHVNLPGCKFQLLEFFGPTPEPHRIPILNCRLVGFQDIAEISDTLNEWTPEKKNLSV